MVENQDQRVKSASIRRRERLKQDLRQAILDSAKKLFLDEGYKAVTMRRVAERVGYSPATIYLYFKDKDDLLFTAADDAYDKFTQDLRTAYKSAEDPIQRLRSLGRVYMNYGIQNPEAYQMIFMQRPDFLNRWKSGTKQPRSSSLLILKKAIQEAQQAGAIPKKDLDRTSDFLWSVVHGAVSLSIAMPQVFACEGLENSMEDILEAAIQGVSSP